LRLRRVNHVDASMMLFTIILPLELGNARFDIRYLRKPGLLAILKLAIFGLCGQVEVKEKSDLSSVGLSFCCKLNT
jgi:hypothetical protein